MISSFTQIKTSHSFINQRHHHRTSNGDDDEPDKIQSATQPRRRSAIFIPPKSYERASALLTARHSSKSVQTTQWTRIPGMSSWQFVQVYLANSSVDGKKRFRDEILQFRTIFSAIRRTRCESLTRHVGCARLVRSVGCLTHRHRSMMIHQTREFMAKSSLTDFPTVAKYEENHSMTLN